MKNIIIPDKLKVGDEIRVIAPARSLGIFNQDIIKEAVNKLENMGFKVSFGKNVYNKENDYSKSANIEDRINDLEDAFKDKNVKCILTAIGGFNSNQLLDYINYDLIRDNPKIICGYSDITALANSIFQKTGVVTYSGPHFSSFAMRYGLDYTIEYFTKMLMNNDDVHIFPSNEWSNDGWTKNQEERIFIKNDGMIIINEGVGEGNIIGGNLCTLNLLQGTEYMPDINNIILFIEDDGMAGKDFIREFDRNFQSLLHSLKGKKLNGVIIGRAEKECNVGIEAWEIMLSNKKELRNIPVVINADFGHTTPTITFPIGGYAKINLNSNIDIKILNNKNTSSL